MVPSNVKTVNELPSTADVVIIGGGIAGAADAFFLARHGLAPVILERRDHLAGLTTSQAVSCFRAQWSTAEHAALVHPSIEFYLRFERETGLPGWSIGLRQQGWLFLTASETGPTEMQSFVADQRNLGVTDSEYLGDSDLHRRFPWIGPAATAGSYRALDGWLSPYEATHGLIRGSGAVVHLGVTAGSVLTSHGRVVGVETNIGRISTDRVVISAGPFSRTLAATAGIDLPVRLLRRHRAHIVDSAIPHDAPMVVDVDTHVYWRPEGEGAFLGQPQPETDAPPIEAVPTDWTFPAVAMQEAGRLGPFWLDVARRLTRDRVSLGAGQYTCTMDGLPLLGSSPIAGLYFHTADNGWGIESAPEAARIVAEVIVGRLREHPYALDRPTIEMAPLRAATY